MPALRQFNTPVEVLSRLVYLAHLMLLGGGGLLAFASAIQHQSGFMLKSAGMISVSFGLRWALKRQGQFQGSQRSFNNLFSSPATAAEPADELHFTALLERQGALERVRGTPDFDPWAMLCLKREIDQCVRDHPELGALLDDRSANDN